MQTIDSMYDNYNYPVGADNAEAPWNQTDNPEREVEVTVSITLSKTLKVRVDDYQIVDSGKDEDGKYFEDIDYSNCDLKEAVVNQTYLPSDAGIILRDSDVSSLESIANDFLDWNVDEFEVMLE